MEPPPLEPRVCALERKVQTLQSTLHQPSPGGGQGGKDGKDGKKSDAELVMEFTEQAAGEGVVYPCQPVPLDKEAVHFLCKMIIDEMLELMQTVEGGGAAKRELIQYVEQAKELFEREYDCESVIPYRGMRDGKYMTYVLPSGCMEQCADQADAMVDIYYYMLNAACKHGMNLSHVFTRVHEANMAKRDPSTGKFLKREDGKIIKPPGWVPPDINSEMVKQATCGTYYGFDC